MPTLLLPVALALLIAQTHGSPAARSDAHAADPAESAALRTQVALDRAGFSPGAIDGRMGTNTSRALAAFRQQGGTLDSSAGPLAPYTVTAADVQASYTPDIPEDLRAEAALPALDYRDVVEALSERFHTTSGYLKALNPGAAFAEGDTIRVPNVVPFMPPARPVPQPEPTAKPASASEPAPVAPPAKPDVVVTVSKSTSAMTIAEASGRVVFYAPVTTGSEHDPLPIGEWKVNGTRLYPSFHYNPDLFWDANPADGRATIPAGPNNPVGLVWIDITREHYGLHGTPEPQAIGHLESHGCVRLTNWDAVRAASLVKPGTLVRFVE